MSSPASSSTLREGLSVVVRGIKGQPRWFSLAVFGSVIYGVMTGLTAWAIGWVTERAVSPAIAARQVTAGQLWFIGGVLGAVVLVNVVGVIIRRLAGGIAMYNLGADYRRQVTRQYLRLPLSWHHRHPSGQLLSNANADVEATWNIFAPLPMAIGVIVMVVFAVVQMVLVDPFLAIVGLTVFPMLLLANVAFQRRHVAAGDAGPAAARRRLRGRARELRGGAHRQEPRPRGPRGRALPGRHARAARRQHRGRPHPWPLRPRHRGDPDDRHPRGAARRRAAGAVGQPRRPPRSCRSPTSSRSPPSPCGRSAGCSPSCRAASSAGSGSPPCSRPRAG